MLTLSLGVRPANPAVRPRDVIDCRAPSISALEHARSFLRAGNPAGYARVLAGEHRSHSSHQQRAIEAAIVSDGTTRLFTRHAGNGCLLAVEG